MIITRKIEIYIAEDDKELRKAYHRRIFDHIDIAVKVANMTVSHLFALDNTMPYLSQEDRDAITFLGVKGQKATRQNAPYVVASELYKGKVSMSMVACVQQNVSKNYQADKKQGLWRRSLRSYKQDMPVPFKASEFLNISETERAGRMTYGFTLAGVPFLMKFGRDRSNNRCVVERIVSGQYKMATSSLTYDTRRKKFFLLLCVDIPKQDKELDPKRTLYARLDVLCPIEYSVDAAFPEKRTFNIGTKEEFLHRRLQIQDALRRCQISNTYTAGGKGRKRKTQAIERWHEKETHYISTKLHLYSRRLVDAAVKNKCGVIHLVGQQQKEDEAKRDHENGEHFVLRNWSYYGLKEKIAYKCKLVGIKLTQDKDEKE